MAEIVGRALPEAVPEVIDEARAGLFGLEALRGLLERALVAEPPLLARDGGFVASGLMPSWTSVGGCGTRGAG